LLDARLKEVPFFSSLNRHELEFIAQSTDEVDVSEGEVLAREGHTGQEFFVILEGRVAVRRGDEQLAELGPGDFFGEMALLGDHPRNATVTATAPGRVGVMTRQAFRSVDRSMPTVHARICDAIRARSEASSS
jgi:CRP-like cAMP-binding protein